DFVLLPELNNIGKNRVKRAGGDEEQAGEPAAKKPRTEPAPINMEVWSEEDRNVLLNIDPELISKFELLCSALRTNAESITQEYLAVIDQNINTLYGLVTGNEAKRQLYGQLEYLHYVVSTLPGTPLYMTPLPQMVPEVSTLATPTVFSASLRPSGWPDEDWNTLHIKFPNIVQMIKTLRRFVKHNKKITQNRLTAIDNMLHEMLSSLSSELARSEVLAVLKELHQKLPLMNNPALRMRSLTGETVTPGEEGAVAPGGEEVVYHIKVNLNKWDEDDKQHIKTVIPDFEQQVKTIYNLSKKATGNEQQEAATFYKNLSIAWEGLKSNPA
ncbi:cysteine protease domain, YopT-type, partial [Escherichia coli]|nr:cysteine protease domain, YopT-type [Escherichia coli]